MTLEMALLSAILVGAAIVFALDIWPVDRVSILVLGALVATRLVTPSEAISGFGNPATITVACMLVLSYGVERSGGLNLLANRIVDLSQGSEFKVLASIIVAVGVLSAFINNTAAVALFLPLTLAVAREQNLSPSKLLMPMSFAAMSAGLCTLIGTSTNLLVYALAKEMIGWEIGMFEFSHVGLIFFASGALYLLTIGRKIIPKRRRKAGLTEDYELRHFVTELILQKESTLIGKTLYETRLGEVEDIEVIEIIRGRERFLPSAAQILQADDLLLVRGATKALMRLKEQYGVTIKALSLSDSDLEDENITLVEAFVSPTSTLIERTIKEVDFRRTYRAIALALRSHGRTVREKIAKTPLEFGDSLLILTTRDHLEVLRASTDFLVLEEVRITAIRRRDFYWAIGIFLSIVVIASLGILSILEAAIVGVAAMVLSGCVRLHDLYIHLSWQTLIMLACLIPMGHALQSTGLATIIATQLVDLLRDFGPTAVLSGLYLLTIILTSIMSNNATAVLMVPIAISISTQLNARPEPFIIGVMFAASASFLTPVGYQTNSFIFGPGGYKFSDFTRVGGPLNLLFWILATILIPIFWPFQ